ncbi:hypothetical protein IFM89_026351 [Coptis chinensis]|uniref:rhamnogalacturonan endolyase n=1 Tax=Coptis chinensis TaxID=261450 RepID=A0A835GY31_9MAGN|nr:hypothetical protein IFM89_026351 [Coptis chinensis]
MDNGEIQVTLLRPEGIVTGIRYKGIENLLDTRIQEDRRGYWDLYWNEPGGPGVFDIVKGTDYRVILQNENQLEISFTRTWNSSQKGTLVPLNIDTRFVMLEGSHGFYTYSIYEHMEGWPDFNLNETRVAFKLNEDLFRNMAVDQNRQRRMPLSDDRNHNRGQPLAYPEAVRLVDPIESEFAGQVDDKYQYSSNTEDIKVHGWMSTDPPVGFWQITPSHEFRSGGPSKQQLTSHVGPTTLSVFISGHYMGQDKLPMFRNGEPWKKVFGPIFIYLNSAPLGSKTQALWEDAENQGYQFWTKSDVNGSFVINNIRPGTYNLYASVPSFIGDYKSDQTITIRPGDNTDLGDLIYTPPRTGPTLWEIGYPDRSAAEFFIPGPDPKFINPLYIGFDRYRQYGLWEQYNILYPNEDLVYTINSSDYRKDWFFAHVTRKTEDNLYKATTWKIRFHLTNVGQRTCTLRLALASANWCKLQVRFNNLNMYHPHFTTGTIGKDNAIARHGIHGLYWLFNIDVRSNWLVEGENVLYLTQANNIGPFSGLMYDYIRFEGSSTGS